MEEGKQAEFHIATSQTKELNYSATNGRIAHSAGNKGQKKDNSEPSRLCRKY